MSRFESEGRPAVVQLALGVLLAGTGLYLVPTLALNGLILAAAIAAVICLGGIAVVWYLSRSESHREAGREHTTHDLYRAFLEHGGEAHVVIDATGSVSFAGPNLRDVLGVDPDQLEAGGTLIDLVSERDRFRALRTYARVRRTPGASETLEVSARRSDGGESYLSARAVNLTHSPIISGVLLVLRDITPRKTFETEIQHLAYNDALTGLANRRLFHEQAEKALSLARRNRDCVAVFYLDVDRLKQVNDVLGHERGDALLQEIAEGLRGSLRESDIVARLGGDEFAVVLAEVRDEEAAGRVARRLLEGMPSSVIREGHEVPVGVSIGVALYPEDGKDLESLVRAADTAMYQVKTRGGAGLEFHRPELRERLVDRVRLEQDMRKALTHHEFHLHYQPVFDVRTGEMAGAEALSRWRHYTKGMVAAAEFIDLAERTGLIRSLDRWAIARGVHQRSTQLEAGWTGWVAVNLSPHSLQDPALPDYIRETLEAARLEPGALVLEMPEDAVFGDMEAAVDLMWTLKSTGAALALDDYGAGTTGIARLKRLPIDILKLHPDLIAGIGTGAGDERLVEATISIAHGIRAKVLAKGVERDEQVEWLRDSGCDFVQGYLMGPPMPAEELAGDRGEPAGTVTP